MKSTCDLCGIIDHDVKPGVVVWVEPHGERYNAVDRCIDHAACRLRVLAAGEEWPIVDGPIQRVESRP